METWGRKRDARAGPLGGLDVKVGVITIAVGDEYRKAVSRSLENTAEWCQRHGYRFIVPPEMDGRGRHPSWQKIPALLDRLSDYDWLWCMDADAVVIQRWRGLEEWQSSGGDLVVPLDCYGPFNCGVMGWRNCDWSRRTLISVMHDLDWKKRVYYEQDSLRVLYEAGNDDFRGHVRIMRRGLAGLVRAFWNGKRRFDHRYHPGQDLMAHLAGRRNRNLKRLEGDIGKLLETAKDE